MAEKTLALTGAELKVEYGGGCNAWLRNDGTGTVYAARTEGVSAGADGVTAIPAGGSAPIYGANGTVYLLGSGSVQLIGNDYSTNPFKTSAQAGGSGADEVARAAITAHTENVDIHVTAVEKEAWNAKANKSDIPTELPASGGNAATVGGISENRLMQNLGYHTSGNMLDIIAKLNKSGFAYFNGTITDTPVSGQYFFANINNASGTISVLATSYSTGATYSNRMNSNNKKWLGWKNIADSGNATSVGIYTEAKIAALEARIAALEAAAGIADVSTTVEEDI